MENYCFVVPHFNHLQQFEQSLPALLETGLSCIIVDDGSQQEQQRALGTLLENHDSVHLVYHRHNRGKGAAVISGCYYARALGFSHAIQIDADGQHHPADAKYFIQRSQQQPEAIISGMPVFDDSAPKARLYGRKVSLIWTAIETFSLDIKDALCGFRVYPLKTVEHLVDHYHIGPRMDFDTDMLVKAKWAGFDIQFIDTQVRYVPAGVSHFRYLQDNLRLIALHLRLLGQAPFQLAVKLARRIAGQSSAGHQH